MSDTRPDYHQPWPYDFPPSNATTGTEFDTPILLDKIISAQDEYIKLLGAELNDVVSYAGIHHWKSTRYQDGVDAREKIESLKQQVANIRG